MALSNDLISQFAKITKDNKKKNSEQTVYGTVVDYNGEKYLKIDGSDLLTPISSTTRANNDERVTAMIKNHTVTVTGNLTSPAARSGDVETIGSKITEFEVAIGDKVDTKELNAQTARIDELYATDVTIKNSLTANAADIKDLQADNATIKGTLTANSADITNLKAENASITGRVTANEANIGTLQADTANITSKLTAAEADIGELEADNATIHGTLDAHKGYIDDLEATKLSAESADIKYANIDFSNIGKAAMEYFYANSGLIKNVVVGDQTITGNLVGVTISGDLIEGNTIVAEKLVVKGEDGLYYKLNTDGITTEAEQTDYNSLNGSVIRAKSITATQISVSDLVAFGATIGGYKITDSSLYSGVKETVGNTTRGVYLDNDGQFAVGDASNYLKFFQDTDGTYKLEVSASSVKFSSSGKSVEQAVNDAIVSTVEQFYLSTSSAGLSGGSWSAEQPTWEEGKYIWRRTLVTYGNGASEYTPSAQGVCITGNTGAKGDTGATGKGVKSNTRYYCLQASATKPSKPTTNPPDSKWTTTEPSYTTGSTSYLYTVDLTVYTDNSFLYSDVSLSSSYEAAKAAYAKAVNAETEISKTNEEVALKASKNEVTETLKGYATTASMNAAITTKANEITSSVAANYSKQLWHTANGTVGTKGYVGFAELTITGSWSNRPILFCLTNRGAVESNISLRFENISGSDPGLYWIRETGGINTWVVKTATSKWTVIAKKSEGYDGINVNDFTNTNPNISIAWTDVHYDAIPDGAVESTKLVGSQAISEIATTADVNDIKTRVTSAETRITQTETDIKSKASQTELSGLTTRVSTAEQDIDAAEAAIKQKAEKTEVSGLSGRVSTVEEDLDAANAQIQLKVNQTEFDNLQIGGTNFTLNSSFSGLTNGGIYTFSGEEVTFNASSTGLTSGIAFWLDMSDNFCKQARNNKVTISVDYKIESALTRGTTNSFAGIQLTVARDTTTGGSSQWIPSHIEYTSVTNGWRKTSVVSDISDYDIANAYIGIYFRDVKGTIKFRHPKVEMGNKATDWSPAPEDAVTSVKTTTVTIDADGMNVSTGGTVEFNTSAFEITPPDGGDQLFSVNASTKNLKAQNGYFTYLSAPNAATKPTSTGTISRSIGNSSGYYPTIQAAWNSLPDVCGYVVFNVYSDSPGTALLNNKHIGNIIIQSNPNTSKFDIGSIEVQGISGVIQNVIMSRNGGQYQPACAVTGSSFQFINVTFATAGRGISIYNGGCALLNNCTITGIGSYDKPQDACLFVNGGVLTSNNTTGVSNNKGVGVYNGSLAVLKGTCPGPSVYAPSGTILGDYTIDGTVAEKPTVSQTATFTPSTWCTWECISGSLWKRLSVDVVVQSRSWSGLNNKTLYPNGFCKRAGWWVLDTGTAIKSALSGKTISRATITIRRDECSETYKVELAYHKVTNCNLNGYSVSADYNIANQLISIGLYDVKGDSDTVIDLPSSLYSKLQDGTIKGFGLLNNGTYFKDVYCDGTCTLNVTYT